MYSAYLPLLKPLLYSNSIQWGYFILLSFIIILTLHRNRVGSHTSISCTTSICTVPPTQLHVQALSHHSARTYSAHVHPPPTHAQRRYTLLCLLTPPKTRMRLPLRKVSCWRFLRRTWTDGGRSGESIVLRVAIVHICVHCTAIIIPVYSCMWQFH